MSVGISPESLSQAILVGIMLVGRLDVADLGERGLQLLLSHGVRRLSRWDLESSSVSSEFSLSLSLYIYIYMYRERDI